MTKAKVWQETKTSWSLMKPCACEDLSAALWCVECVLNIIFQFSSCGEDMEASDAETEEEIVPPPKVAISHLFYYFAALWSA